VTERFQDGRRRRRYVGNLSACYKIGNYHSILMKIGTQAKPDMLNSKITKAKVWTKFQHDSRRHFRNSSACCKMGDCHPILMKFDTQTKIDMLSLIITKAEVYGKKTPKS
jgi:hypothetical protein